MGIAISFLCQTSGLRSGCSLSPPRADVFLSSRNRSFYLFLSTFLSFPFFFFFNTKITNRQDKHMLEMPQFKIHTSKGLHGLGISIISRFPLLSSLSFHQVPPLFRRSHCRISSGCSIITVLVNAQRFLIIPLLCPPSCPHL